MLSEQIVPSNQDCKTISEITKLCTAMHKSNLEQVDRLNSQINETEGHEKCEDAQSLEELESPTTPFQQRSFIPRPLDQVVETDNETDGTKTPGNAFSSPKAFGSTQTNKSSMPPTPTAERLNLR